MDHTENIKSALVILSETQQKINETLTPHPELRMRCDGVIRTLYNGMAFMVGEPILDEEVVTEKLKPFTSFMGAKLPKDKPQKKAAPIDITQLPNADTAQQAKAEAFRLEVEAAYPTFLERENKDIKESMDDLLIRGIAKKAGMIVSVQEPKNITLKFIDEIKEAIKQKAIRDKQL